MSKNGIRIFFTPYTKINSKCIRDLNAKLRAIKLLEENIGRTLFGINPSHIFLDPSPKEKVGGGKKI